MSGKSIDECLDELELSFTNGEIVAFCTVIKSLQTTGQVDEALKTLETNITREEVSVNKRRCAMLENKTMMTAFLVIIFGTFSSISNKWNRRQAAKEHLLVMDFEHSIRNEN